MKISAIATAALVIASLGSPVLAAEDMKLTVGKDESVATVLVRYEGKAVTLTLRSGTEMSGVVRMVGDHVVHIGELRGKEFYDAVVPIDELAAVVVRVRSR